MRLHIEVEGLLEKVISLPPARRELLYDRDTDKWKRTDDDEKELPSILATSAEPLLGAGADGWEGTRLVLPDAADHEALAAGLILRGKASARIGLGERSSVKLPALLREPSSRSDGVGLIELARANAAWQLAEANDLLASWQRWTIVEELEGALIEQLCGPNWRALEAQVDQSFCDFHSGLLRFIFAIWDETKGDRPQLEHPEELHFLRSIILKKLKTILPDKKTAVTSIDYDLAGTLDEAMEDAYDALRDFIEARGGVPDFSGAVGLQTEDWQVAAKKAFDAQKLLMFERFILPKSRWSSLVSPWYSELGEDDLVDLLDSCHVDAFRRPGLRWVGRAELRTMLQLWLSPKLMVETEGWRDLLAKALSDVQTSRAVRYVALRRKLALGDLPDGGGN